MLHILCFSRVQTRCAFLQVKRTHTHTHTHIYIYVDIVSHSLVLSERVESVDGEKSAALNESFAYASFQNFCHVRICRQHRLSRSTLQNNLLPRDVCNPDNPGFIVPQDHGRHVT